MKVYEAVFDQENKKTKGVFGISLVKRPAMESVFIALSEQERQANSETVQFSTIDEEQRILIGLVLEPNKQVYRNQGGKEFEVFFSEETIKDVAYNFFKEDFHKNSTIEHDADKMIEGITFVESWVVEDVEKDKQAVHGLKHAKGSWLVTMKVDNEDIWNDYVKTGKVQGFSIDALMSLQESDRKPQTNLEMSKKNSIKETFLNFCTNTLGIKFDKKEPKETELKLGEVKIKDEELMISYEGEELKEGVQVFVVTTDEESGEEERIPLPVAEYPLEDGRTLVVSEEGVAGEIKESGEPENEPVEQVAANAEEQANAIKSVLIKYLDEKFEAQDKKTKELIEEVKTEFKDANKKTEEKLLELGEQPARRPETNTAVVELTSEGRILKAIREQKAG